MSDAEPEEGITDRTGSRPEERITDRTRGQPDHAHYGDIIAAIPLFYASGLVVWWLAGLELYVALAGASLLAIGAMIDALFLNPPTA